MFNNVNDEIVCWVWGEILVFFKGNLFLKVSNRYFKNGNEVIVKLVVFEVFFESLIYYYKVVVIFYF